MSVPQTLFRMGLNHLDYGHALFWGTVWTLIPTAVLLGILHRWESKREEASMEDSDRAPERRGALKSLVAGVAASVLFLCGLLGSTAYLIKRNTVADANQYAAKLQYILTRPFTVTLDYPGAYILVAPPPGTPDTVMGRPVKLDTTPDSQDGEVRVRITQGEVVQLQQALLASRDATFQAEGRKLAQAGS
jgi:hypothetical protein